MLLALHMCPIARCGHTAAIEHMRLALMPFMLWKLSGCLQAKLHCGTSTTWLLQLSESEELLLISAH